MNLNLGCGDRYAKGFWNVDWEGSPHQKDEVADLRASHLPWTEVERVYVGHLLEHLNRLDAEKLLSRLLLCMAPGGAIMVVGPDIKVATEMAKAGTLEVPLDELKFGAQRWPGDEHMWECDAEQVAYLLTVAGWQEVTDVGINDVHPLWPVADRNPQWQCAIHARRGDG